MNHLRLVVINLRRHRVRTAIGVAGIALGVAAMFSVIAVVRGAIGMFQGILAHDTEMLVFERNVSDLFFSAVDDEDLEKLRAMPEVDSALPLLFGLVSTQGHPVVTCFGVSPEDPRLDTATWLAGDRAAFGRREGEIVLGARASEFLEAGLGEKVTIGARDYIVGGVVQTRNGFEDGGVFLPLATAREYFRREGVSSIITIKLRDSAQAAAFRERVAAEIPYLIALENAEFNRGYSQFKILRATSWAVGLAAFLLGGLGVANTMVLSVFVRIRELAILKSCGFSPRQVASLILGESLVVSLAGAVLGLGLGYAAVVIMKHLPFLQGYVMPQLEWTVAAAAVLVAGLTGAAGAAWPARFAMRIETARALRYE
ncbi:MAG: ABC transporter permease [Opitutaceae bacterium]|nr:ABC transporter permease [Opitutaceae bacterium]